MSEPAIGHRRVRRRQRVLYNARVAAQSFNLSNTILYCRRWAETVDFYRRVLGLPVNVEKDWFVEFRLPDTSFVSVADASRASIDSAAGAGITLTLRRLHPCHRQDRRRHTDPALWKVP